MKVSFFFVLLLLSEALLFSGFKPWYNYYNFAYGTRALSLGNAFTAKADDLTAIYWNPAGIVQTPSAQFYLSYRSDSLRLHEAQDHGSGTDAQTFDYQLEHRLNQIDFFSICLPARLWKRPWGFAFSYYRYIPYGFTGMSESVLSTNQHWVILNRSVVISKGSEGMDAFGFTAAMKVHESLSLGITVQQLFNSGIRQLQYGPLDPSDYDQYIERLGGRNLILGILFRPVRAVTVGFSFHSAIRGQLTSSYLSWSTDAAGKRLSQRSDGSSGGINIPEHYSIGLAVRPAAFLSLNYEYAAIPWEKGSLSQYYGSQGAVPFPLKSDFNFKQKDSVSNRFGGEARLHYKTKPIFLRGGWSRDRQLYVDNHLQQVTLRALSMGIGIELYSYMLVEFAYQHQRGRWSEDGYGPWGGDMPAQYAADVFRFSVTYNFDRIFQRD
jgi:hypothetical protein